MKADLLKYLVCPKTRSELRLEAADADGLEIKEGFLINESGDKYSIYETLPDMIYEEAFIGDAIFARDYYTGFAETYDERQSISFDLYNDTEDQVRNKTIGLLNLTPQAKVLEISAGTGKVSERILTRLGGQGRLTALDITPAMLQKAKKNLEGRENVDFVAGTATALPFRDKIFDACYCFTGVGHFPDVARALKEMARVVRTGGRVVFCEKNVPPWLRNTDYGKILINNNPMFAHEVPLKYIPVEARDLEVHWILGNVHYAVAYTVGAGEPLGNFDLELPGDRGGTFNTRYYGQLEGVTPLTKQLALKAYKKTGRSMHKWLDELIRREAEKILESEDCQ